MIINEWIEPYTLMMGIHTMDVCIEAICVSGLVYAPFALAIVRSIVKAMTEGEDEGNAGVLAVKFLRKDLLSMIPVMVICFIPASGSGVTFSSAVTNYACDAAQRKQDPPTTTQQSMIGNFGNAESRVPIWWSLVHDYSSTFTNIVINSTPCAADISMATTNLQSSALNNGYDQQLSKQWQQACLNNAMSELTKTSSYNKDWWPGHADLRDVYKKQTSVVDVPIDVAQSAGLPIPANESGSSVQVNCDVVYQHIETEALNSAKKNNPDSFGLMTTIGNMYDSDYEKKIALDYVAKISTGAPDASKFNSSLADVNAANTQSDNDSGLTARVAAWIGTAVGNILKAPGAVIQKNTLPIVVCVLQMMLIAVVPILLTFSGFSIKTAFALSVLYFGLEFTLEIVNLATWVDNTLTLIFYSSGANGVMALSSGTGAAETISGMNKSVLTSVGYMSYDLLPKAWMALMAYLGVKGGSSMLAGGTAAEQAASSGMQTLIRLTSSVNKSLKSLAKDRAKSDYERSKPGGTA
jgi:TraG-like protein, N-terminal region.